MSKQPSKMKEGAYVAISWACIELYGTELMLRNEQMKAKPADRAVDLIIGVAGARKD